MRIRGKAHTEELKGGMEQIVITEIPYNVNRATLVTRIAELVSEKEIDGIRDLRDESDENTRIVVELKRGEQAKVVINQLFQKTALESSFGVTLLALDQKRPKQMNIKELIECYIAHRRDVVTRRTRFRLKEAEDRAHILEGYIIALDNLDDFVRIIRASQNRDEAKTRLMAKYPLSERQTDAILELRLYQLTGLERGKIEAEYIELMKLIEELRGILDSEAKLMALIKKELLEMKAKYTSPRRTIIEAAAGEFRMEDVVPNEGCVITVSHLGFIKRTPVADYRSQRRGGKGVIGAETYDEDFVEHLFTASTHDYILFFSSTGQCHAKKCYDVPEGTRASKGKSVSSFLRLGDGEKIAAMMCIKDFVDDRFLVMATKSGVIKKSSLSDYANATRDATANAGLFRGSAGNYIDPMMLWPAFHDDTAKAIVGGRVLPAGQGGVKDLRDALDANSARPPLTSGRSAAAQVHTTHRDTGSGRTNPSSEDPCFVAQNCSPRCGILDPFPNQNSCGIAAM